MPRKRRRERIEAISMGPALFHLARGDCLLAGHGDGCGCGLVLANGELRLDTAEQLWRERRAEIVAECVENEPAWIALELVARRRA